MRELFAIETDRVFVTLSVARDRETASHAETQPGRLIVRPRRPGLVFGDQTWRAGVPAAVAGDPHQTVGPLLFEQTDYIVYATSKSDQAVSIESRDPNLVRSLAAARASRVVHGVINFGSQVGLAELTIRIDGRPELDCEVEVFPSKLDYASDYELLLADVQDILTGLVLEYLRATYRLGTADPVPQPTHVEWLTLLRRMAKELQQGIELIAQRPQRTLQRDVQLTRLERTRRVDSALRSAIRRGAGRGRLLSINNMLAAHERVPASRLQSTLDTPEHRWLAVQVAMIRRRLARLRHAELQRARTPRRDQTLAEIDSLSDLMSHVAKVPPLAGARGLPPSGFASLRLLRAPGYREAYQACMVLLLGLRIAGGPVGLSTKDLSRLYEYWCFLALLRLIAQETRSPIPVSQLIGVESHGLTVRLQHGRQCAIPFTARGQRHISVIYNPLIAGSAILTPQQPDILVSVDDPGWPTLHMVIDAKYRLDTSPEYVARYRSPGPPDDALNVLHRYRDAILDASSHPSAAPRPKRSVVQAAALFPYHEPTTGAFARSRQWQAIERIGIGALPFLPGSTAYVEAWIRSILSLGGWGLADRVVAHRAEETAATWRAAAAEVVLIGVLRPGAEQAHLSWIQDNRQYYLPMLRTQQRQYAAHYVAIYSPSALRWRGAVTHVAEVAGIDVLARRDIPTPWSSASDEHRLYVVYRLNTVQELPRPILNRAADGHGVRFSTHRWTSRLGLARATNVGELLLETEAEWRLYEALRAASVPFDLEPGPARLPDEVDQLGRVWFVTRTSRAQYRGAAGFTLRPGSGAARYVASIDELVTQLGQANTSAT